MSPPYATPACSTISVAPACRHDLGQAGHSHGEQARASPLASVLHRALARPEALARLGAIAAAHHERLDGSGYHRGLTGAALSTPARILAAADAYHAMTEPRPHRPPLTPKEPPRAPA